MMIKMTKNMFAAFGLGTILTVSTAQAQVLEIDVYAAEGLSQPNGTIVLTNNTGSAIAFDGYEINSDSGALSPAGFFGIEDHVNGTTDQLNEVIATFGTGGLQFGAIPNLTSNVIAELSAGASGGTLQDGGSFSIEQAYAGPTQDLVFTYNVVGSAANEIAQGQVNYIIPEPGSLALLGLGGLALLRRRRSA